MKKDMFTLLVVAASLLATLPPSLVAQTKRDKEPNAKEEAPQKGLSLKEARRIALDNNYDLIQTKKQLVDKRVSRQQYDNRQAKLLADLERAYMGLYVARLELQVGQQRAARGSTGRIASRAGGAPSLKDAKALLSPELAEQERAIAKAREMAYFIPLEQQLKTQELNLKVLLNSKKYSLRSDEDIVPTDRPVPLKKDLDEDALIEKAFDHSGRLSGTTAVARGRGPREDRTASEMDHEKKRIIAAVQRAVLRATASSKRLEIARQVKELQQKRLDLLRNAKADPAEVAAAEDAFEDASMDELRTIVSNNSDMLDIGEITGSIFKDLNVTPED